MNENEDYWRELLGDSYNEDLMKMLSGGDTPSDNKKSTDRNMKASERDESRSGGARSGGSPEPAPAETPAWRAPDNKPSETRDEPEIKSKDDDFNVEFNFDEEYQDVPDNGPLHPRRDKKTGCASGFVYAAVIVCASILLAVLLWLAATDVLGLGNKDKTVQVTVPKNFTMAQVDDALYKGGLIKYKFLFGFYASLTHASQKIVAGTYDLNTNYDYRALVNGMTLRGGKRAEVEVTIPEGFTLKKIFELFETNRICTEAELWDAATNYDFSNDFLDKATLGNKYRLEGYLFPDTYKFYVGDSPTAVISKMLDNFQSKFTDAYQKRAKELGYSEKDIVIVASMIEKEAGGDAERAKIASVIYNRLKSGSLPYLQIDATINYAIAETGQAFSTTVDSPYNTYLHKGLPPGPIANPGIASIKAALYPDSTNYYYYALNKNGMHNFFSNVSAFNAFIKSADYGG